MNLFMLIKMDNQKKKSAKNLNDKTSSYRARNTSPLRNKSKSKTSIKKKSTRQDFDEEAYERRKQQELRDRILIKEKQLKEIAEQANRMRQKFNKSNTASSHSKGRVISRQHKRNTSKSPQMGGGLRSQKIKQSFRESDRLNNPSLERTSPLRNRQTSNSRSKSPIQYRGSTLDITQQRGNSPLRNRSRSPKDVVQRTENSPLRNRSRSPIDIFPERQESSRVIRPMKIISGTSTVQLSDDFTRAEILDGRCREKIETLQIDNESLRRRLNLVEMEYQRALKDKQAQYDKLASLKIDQDRISRQLNTDGSIDIQNNQAKDQLQSEKTHNSQMRQQIEELNLQKSQTDKDLIFSISQQKQLNIQNSEINHELDNTLQKLDIVYEEKLATLNKIQEINLITETVRRDELSVNHDLITMDTAIEKMRNERNALLKDLESDTREYNLCVKDIGRQKTNLDETNVQQQKFIAAKVIFNNLQLCQHNKQISAFKEFYNYSDFDKKCQVRLKSFAFIISRLGKFKMENALHQWYNNALKPYDTINQNHDLAARVDQRRYLAKVFYGWKQYYEGKLNEYKNKTDSIQLIWERLCLSRKQELKRGMDIWKGAIVNEKLKKQRVRKVVIKMKNNMLRQALGKWQNVSMVVEEGVRMHLLKLEYAQKFFLTSVYNAFKLQIKHEKRQRLTKQELVIKAWKDHLALKRHMMQMNMSAITYTRVNKTYMLKVCFDAFKVNKETRKSGIMQQALSTDMDVALEAHNSSVKRTKAKMVRSAKKKSGNIVRDMLGKRLFAYFNHWKKNTEGFKTQMNTKIKGKIISMYRDYMLSYFSHWKKNATQKKKRKRKKMMQQMQQETAALEEEGLVEQKKEKEQAEAVRSVKTKKNNKMFKKYILRIQQNALNRWKDKMQFFKVGKQQNNMVLDKMRKRFLKDAFQRYKMFSKKGVQHERNEKSADYLVDTINMRTLRRHYNAFCAYTAMHKSAKRYLKKIFNKIEQWNLKNVVKKWKINAHQNAIEKMQTDQNVTNETIAAKNHEIGKNEKLKEEQDKQIIELNKNLQRKGHKQIANYLMRYYTDNITKRFRSWKEITSKQKQKEKIMKNAIEHMRKNQFIGVKSAFKNFITQEKVAQKKRRRAKVMMEQEEIQQVMKHNEEVQQQTRQKTKAVQVQSKQKQNFHGDRLNKTILSITRRNQNLVFSSKKRMIFNTWYHCVKQQKAFLLCVNNVLTKSMTMKGLIFIKNYARETDIDRRKYRHMNQMILRFLRNNVGDYFSKWKNGANTKVDSTFSQAQSSNAKTVMEFNNRIDNIKEMNTSNVEHFIKKRRLKEIWRQWRRVKKEYKVLGTQNVEATETLAGVRFRRALQKWYLRVETTKRIRRNIKTMKYNHSIRFKRSMWEALLCRRSIKVDLAMSISNVERLFRQKNYLDAFKTIKSFSTSKKFATEKFKKKSNDDIVSILSHIHEQRLRKYFGLYRSIVKVKSQNSTHVKKIVKKMYVANLRDGFFRWKKYMEKEVLKQEMNETGPITEQVFEANRTIKNLTDFMRNENFTPEEIAAKLKSVNEENEQQMHWIVKRLKTKREDRQMNRCFDHWVFWIKVKRLFKYHLQKANFAQIPVKCDLFQAFQKWKQGDKNMASHMDKQSFKTLCNLNMKQCRALDSLADNEAESSTALATLSTQRDELLDHYVRSQKLALALIRDGHRMAQMQAIDRWKVYFKDSREREGESTIADAVTRITHVKQRMQELEKTNANLAQENEQLRKFSLDGFQIAKNVQHLANERERLSVDLADKASTIQQLLEQNQALKDQFAKMGLNEVEELQNPNERKATTKGFMGLKNFDKHAKGGMKEAARITMPER